MSDLDIQSTHAEPGTGADNTDMPNDVISNDGIIDVENTPSESVFTPEELASARTKHDPASDPFKTFRGDDGQLNEDAAAKAYSELRAKMSEGKDIPDNPDGYVYDWGSEQVDAQTLSNFQKEALEQGFTQQQYEFVMNAYKSERELFAQELANGQHTAEQASVELQQAWGNDYDANMQQAAKAFKEYGGSESDVNLIADNPAILKILANIGKDMGEDYVSNTTAADAATFDILSSDELTALRNRPDYYTNKEVQAKVAAHYNAKNSL